MIDKKDLEGFTVEQLKAIRDQVDERLRELGFGSSKIRVTFIPHGMKIDAIRSVRCLGGLGLKMAHDLCTNWPFDLIVVVNDAVRTSEIEHLLKIGCKVET